tara:strand:+ start:662 stop:1942 length:1281 start_codon:yes stop_codon:yes gene_type:complete
LSNNKIFNCEVIIVGAGIAGISAAKILEKNNISNIVIEANNQLGGRAKKAKESFGNWFDLGCSYLHEGDINPLRSIAESLNVPINYENSDIFSIEKTKYLQRNKPFLSNKNDLLKKSHDQFLKKLNFYKYKVDDNSLSSCLNKCDPYYHILFDNLTGLNGIEANLVSAVDFASVNDGKDFIIESGLANLIHKWARGINSILNNPVTQINWEKDYIEIYTQSKKYICKSVLLTVSNGILQNQDINFIPQLPNYKIQAIHNLPMGILNKIGVLFKKGTFKENDIGWYVATTDMNDIDKSQIISFEIRKREKEHMIFFFGGKKGYDVENFPDKYYKIITTFIKNQFGNHIENNIVKIIHTSWGKDPFTKGSYSFALPGHSSEREFLRKSLEKKVYFAGEATIKNYYGTCHGAYISGVYAANEIISDLSD